jgi:hypothetical protein
MNANPRLSQIFSLLLGVCAVAAHAEDKPKPPATKPPSEAELRAVITKGLGFLAKEGDEWMGAKDCNGCHHMPELLWSHREAKARGFAIDEKLFEEFVTWSDAHATNISPGSEMTALMKLAMPGKPAPELTKLIVKGQQPDGSWKPAGQFSGMQKRGAPDAAANATRLFLIALTTHEADRQAADEARAKAAAVLANKDAPTSMESLVFRTIFARSPGKPEEADALRAEILKQQRGDGGWSSVIGENMSDPLATGQVLYALQASFSDPRTAEAIARAQQWLLKTQRGDGSWPIDITHISKVDRSAPAKAKSFKDATGIYTYWGAGWATIGLLQAVPVKDGGAK